MRLPSLLRQAWLLHVLAWLCFAVYEQSVLLFTHAPQVALLPIFLNYLLNAALFYANSGLLLQFSAAQLNLKAFYSNSNLLHKRRTTEPQHDI